MDHKNAKRADGGFALDLIASPVRFPHKSPLPMFSARCEASSFSDAAGNMQSLCLCISQKLRRQGIEQSWDTVVVQCGEEADGTLAVRVLISNPDWDEPLQIAHLRSRPSDAESLTALGCNLDHRRIVV